MLLFCFNVSMETSFQPASMLAVRRICNTWELKGRFLGHTSADCNSRSVEKCVDAGDVPPCSQITFSETMCGNTLTYWFKLPEHSHFCQIWRNVPFLTQHFHSHCDNRKSFFSVEVTLFFFPSVLKSMGPSKHQEKRTALCIMLFWSLPQRISGFMDKPLPRSCGVTAWHARLLHNQEYLLDIAAKQMPSNNRTNFVFSCLCLCFS